MAVIAFITKVVSLSCSCFCVTVQGTGVVPVAVEVGVAVALAVAVAVAEAVAVAVAVAVAEVAKQYKQENPVLCNQHWTSGYPRGHYDERLKHIVLRVAEKLELKEQSIKQLIVVIG